MRTAGWGECRVGRRLGGKEPTTEASGPAPWQSGANGMRCDTGYVNFRSGSAYMNLRKTSHDITLCSAYRALHLSILIGSFRHYFDSPTGELIVDSQTSAYDLGNHSP
jgi:hypothetical protein